MAAKSEVTASHPSRSLVLEPLVVNLADDGGKAYLRVGLTLRVEDPESQKDARTNEEGAQKTKGNSEADTAVRDAALEVLGRQTAEELLSSDGKEHLKSELKTAIAEKNRELKVVGIYFTEFLVQR